MKSPTLAMPGNAGGFACLSAMAALVFVLWSSTASGAERQVLQGHVPAAAAHLRATGRLPETQQLDLAISLPLRNREALTNLLQQIYNPATAEYHHFLTPEQFAERFGPTEADYQAVIAFAQSQGLTVTGTHPNRTLVDVRGPVAAIERAFHLKLLVYQHPSEARTFFAPDSEPSLDLTAPALAICGLDNYLEPHPMKLRAVFYGDKVATDTNTPPDATAYATGSGPRGNFIGKDFRDAYAPGVSLNGAGQAVGLFELDGYYATDITAYERLAGLPNVPLTNVLLDGVSGFPGGDNIEVALDIDMAIAMAPGLSRVIVYEGKNSLPNDILNRMATDNQAKQLSSSWGFGSQVDATREQIFQQFAAQGQSMFQAAGDNGAWTGAITPPSDDPLLTIVGGTALTTGTGGAWVSETVWPDSGGGISTAYSIPVWQQGLITSANMGSTTMRNIPDVACLADDAIWLIANNGQEASVGGTSAAAPLWAGFLALANQQAAASGKPAIGFLNPILSEIGQGSGYASDFHDITSGNNTNAASPSRFFAVPGYDLCTGWGTPSGSNLIAALVSPPDALLITPPAGFTAVGAAGGPFSPSAQTFSVTTYGPALNWTLANSAPWLSVSPTNGTVASNTPATAVTFSLNSAASNLVAGSYTATVWFTNLNDGFAQSRQFALDVITRPAIITQPSNVAALPGALATFTVGVAANAQLFYQWQENGTNLTDGGNISGSLGSTLALANVSSNNAGTYAVIVNNALGSIESSNATLTVLSVTAPGIGLATLYSFQGANDGANPNGLLQAANGNFYGTTQGGGSNGAGTIFSLTAGNTPAVLYAFTGGNDGGNPQDALVQAPDGTFFGTTFVGGATDNGTVFNATTNGTLNTLVSFNITNGDLPFAGLTAGTDGNYYGTTYQGGASGRGSVYRMTPGGQLTTLYSFTDGNDGGFVHGGLVQGKDGNFYGTTYAGGIYNSGTIFKITTNGLLTTLVPFSVTNGSFPDAGLTGDENGNLYGVTTLGGGSNAGTIFEITSGGLFTNLYSFTGGSDGAQPVGALALGGDGNIYGTAAYGGAYRAGTLFRLARNGTVTTLLQFDGYNGANPAGVLTPGADGGLYGTTQNGGTGGAGTIFRLSFSGVPQITTEPANQTVYSGATAVFGLVTTGGEPMSYRWAANGTNLTDGGNISGSGARVLVISNVTPANAALYSVTVSNSSGTAASTGAVLGVIVSPPLFTAQPTNLTLSPGATATFAASVVGSQPLVYRWQYNGANLSDGSGISGSATSTLSISSVTEANEGSYALLASNPVTSVTSTTAVLTVVPGSAAGTRYTTLHSFSGGSDGYSPSRLTLGTDGNLYGTTEFGGSLHAGTVFRVSANGVVTNLAAFGAGTGFGPCGGVVQGLDGNYYGITQFGGTNSVGNVFRMTPGGVLSNIYSFQGGADGNAPVAPLLRGADGNFYGTTQLGGNFGVGNVFRISTNGSIKNVYSFTGGTDGSLPTNGLMQASDGNFYGVTQYGGTQGIGSIFRLTPGGAFSTVYSFTGGSDGSDPNDPLAQGPDGALYGTTRHSIFHGFQFYGVIFKVTTNGAFTTLYTLNFTDGSYPAAGLIQGNDGNFYGTTPVGGTADNGTVFSTAPNGTMTTLVNLDGFDEGAGPVTPLTQGADGNYYGTTTTGGPGGHGNIFRLSFTSAPQITTSPTGQSTYVGGRASMNVAVLGSPMLSYQWQLNGTNLSDGGNFIGSASRILTITNAAMVDAGMYSVIVTNPLGSATSAPAQLSISLQPMLITPVWTNGNFVFNWGAVPGRSYQVQYVTNLNSTNWVNSGAAFVATNENIVTSDVVGADRQRFYRVLLLP